jgi:hypothetical protein
MAMQIDERALRERTVRDRTLDAIGRRLQR